MPAASAVRIIDIEPPLAPVDDTGLWLFALAALVLLAGSGVLAWRHFASRRGRALRRLVRLQTRLDDLNPHQAAFRLAALLRCGLDLPGIATHGPAPSHPDMAARWRAFVVRLDRARYRPLPASPAELATLADETRYWLKRWH